MPVILKSTSDNRSDDPTLMYHYTSLDAMLGIIRRDNIVMWATHYQYLNDKDEIIKGVNAMKAHEPSISSDIFENLFILSFSNTIDDLSMWYMYSAGYSGCMLGFRQSIVSGDMSVCTYGNDEAEFQIKGIKQLLSEGTLVGVDENTPKSSYDLLMDRNTLLRRSIIATAIGFKNKEFAFEKEVRIYVDLEEEYSHIIKYRKRNSEIIPYIECLIEKDALAEIWIPNNEAKDRTKKSIERMLKQYGYNNTIVKVSNTSFRP